MTSQQFITLYKIMYGSALRVSEALMLQVKDLDLKNCIITIRNAKTGFKKCKACKGQGCKKCNWSGKIKKAQFTTILPNDSNLLTKYIQQYKLGKNDYLFKTTRQTVWKYGKKAGKKARLNIFEMQEERAIHGVWTHLFRKSRAKQMLQDGASEELVKLKLRHSMSDVTWRYIRPDINTLRAWEDTTYPLVIDKPD